MRFGDDGRALEAVARGLRLLEADMLVVDCAEELTAAWSMLWLAGVVNRASR